MKHLSFFPRITAILLTCALCSNGLSHPFHTAKAADSSELPELPARFDLRDENVMTSVKRQYHGTCVIFACFAAIESNLIKQGMADTSIDLAEQHYSWFTYGKGSPDDPLDLLTGDRENLGLDGYDHAASFWSLTSVLAAWTGPTLASSIPDCEEFVPIDESFRYDSIAHLQNAHLFDITDTDNIKRNIMENGGMHLGYVTVSKPNRYSQYGAYYHTGDEEGGGGHAVCLCGWDDNFPKEKFLETPPGDGAWICKNSWGPNTTAGVDGYTYISYYDASVSNPVQFYMEPSDNYDGIYQRCGACNSAYTTSNRGWEYANIYTAAKDDNLTAVSIITHEADLPYEITVYALNDNYKDPKDGEIIAKISGTEHYAGYHTYPLHTACQVTKGQTFSAVVKTGIHPATTIFFDRNPDHSATSFYRTYDEKGESSWKDSTALETHGNVLVKVFTKDGTAINEQNYPDALYRQAVSEVYDTNEDFVITEQEKDAAENYLHGDVNCDGKVNAVDLAQLKQALLGNASADICLLAGDWNDDQALNAEDVNGMLEFLLTGTTKK